MKPKVGDTVRITKGMASLRGYQDGCIGKLIKIDEGPDNIPYKVEGHGWAVEVEVVAKPGSLEETIMRILQELNNPG